MKRFWTELESWGDAPCLIEPDGTTISYSSLAARADAHFGYPAGTLVLLALDNSVASIVAYLSALRKNLPAIIVNAGSSDFIQDLIERYRPRAYWTPVSGVQEIKEGDKGSPTHPDLAIMLSTSGSTGATKLVRLSAGAVDSNARSIVNYLQITPNDRAITTLPPGYSYGLSVINSHLAAGASIVLSGISVMERSFGEAVQRLHVTSIAGVPYTYELLERTGFIGKIPPSIRTMTQAGGRLPADRATRIANAASHAGVNFFLMYGQTEATARMAYLPTEQLAAHPDCIGIAIPEGSFELSASSDSAVPEGAGELIYRGPNIMMGYANCADDLAKGSEIDHLETGDLAERLPSGIYRIIGRKSRFIKPLGLRIALDDVESLLADTCVSVIATGNDDLLVVGVVQGNLELVSDCLSGAIALPQENVAIVPLDEVPRLDSGKCDYSTVLAIGLASKENGSTGFGDNAGADSLARQFANALGVESVDLTDSFESLSGDSLSYVQVIMAIEDRLGFLPENWERLAIRDIEALAGTREATDSRRYRWMSSEMLIRPFAIIMVLMAHALGSPANLHYHGGSFVLLIAAGYNMARFQQDRLLSPGRFSIITRFFARLIIPYYIILILEQIFSSNNIGWMTIALVNNIWKDPGVNTMTQFWFIQVLFQCTSMMVIMFYARPVRKLAESSMWLFSLILLMASYLANIFGYKIFNLIGASSNEFRTDLWVYAFALGWMIFSANSITKRILTVITTYIISAYHWGISDSQPIFGCAAVIAILFFPRVKINSYIAVIVSIVAQSIYFIYLTQGITINIIRDRFGVDLIPVLIIMSTVIGVCSHYSWQAALATFRIIKLRLAKRFDFIFKAPDSVRISGS